MAKVTKQSAKAIPAFKLVPAPLDEAAAELPKFKYASPEVGTRHRLGGAPDFIQADDYPICPACSERMTFYGQLDSINDEFNLADCGMIYVFVCFGCFETKSVLQSY
jgi:hypothetical protein